MIKTIRNYADKYGYLVEYHGKKYGYTLHKDNLVVFIQPYYDRVTRHEVRTMHGSFIADYRQNNTIHGRSVVFLKRITELNHLLFYEPRK
jgi:hypothetical protein